MNIYEMRTWLKQNFTLLLLKINASGGLVLLITIFLLIILFSLWISEHQSDKNTIEQLEANLANTQNELTITQKKLNDIKQQSQNHEYYITVLMNSYNQMPRFYECALYDLLLDRPIKDVETSFIILKSVIDGSYNKTHRQRRHRRGE